MARVNYSKFAARKGSTLKCGKCGAQIEKGSSYRWFKIGFRSRTKNIRCMRSECTPRQSEMTYSKMAGVYAAIEEAEDELDTLAKGDPEEDASSLEGILTDAATDIRSVAEEYREAAEASPTGLVFGEDLNERADIIEAGADELEQWSADDPEPDMDSVEWCPDHGEDAIGDDDGMIDALMIDQAREDCEQCRDNVAAVKDEWWAAVIKEARDALTSASFD